MDVVRNIILGLLFVALGFAAYATNAQLDPVWRTSSVIACGIVGSIGSVVFFYLAFRRR